MDISSATKKWSDLHGLAVVSLADGKKIGTCDDFYFETDTQRVYALRVKTGMLGHKVLPVAAIGTIGQDAITTANEEGLRSESEDKSLSSLGAGQNLHSYKVMSASGTAIGTIGNVVLQTEPPTALCITAFELAGGLREHLGGAYPTFAASQVLRYGQDMLVIPDEVAQSLH